MEDTPIYKTSDTATAAYLCCRNFKLIRMEPDANNHTTFVFENSSSELKQAVYEYEIGSATVNALSFHKQYRRLLREVRNSGKSL